MPDHSMDGPARWKLIEATNGYDVDNTFYLFSTPVPPGLPARRRGVGPGSAIGRFLSSLAAVQRRRRDGPIAPAPAFGSNV